MMSPQEAVVVTGIFKNRWRALMSVDDVIAGVIGVCEELGVADNTYFFYSSDHGFQLGEFNIPMDKRQPYDYDTRIHLLARGPGIKPGTTWTQPATQVSLSVCVWLFLWLCVCMCVCVCVLSVC
jgi:N-acetylglucosamine-6-sulfatase